MIGRLNLKEMSLDDLNVIMEYEEEGYRCGNFERIFPLEENCDYYSEFFREDRYRNRLLWRYIKKQEISLSKF